MKRKSEISDEEINQYMDFDGLLHKQAVLVNKIQWWKYSVPVVILTAASIWYFVYQPGPAVSPEQLVSKQEVATSPEELTQPKEVVLDSVSTEAPSEPKTKQIDNHRKISKPTGKAAPDVIKNESIKENVYVQAEPIDGYTTLYTFLNNHVVYPKEALKDSLQGVVTVSFVINGDGTASHIEASQSLGPAFQAEAIRLVETMPRWKSATLNGKPVPSKISLPITFQIKSVN